MAHIVSEKYKKFKRLYTEMNKGELSNVQSQLEELEKIDIDNLIAGIFQDQSLEGIMIGQFSVADFVSTFKRIIKQLRREIEENGQFLPNQYNFQNEYGSGLLQSDLQHLLKQFQAQSHAHLNSAVNYLLRLAYYQVANGFWDKSKKKLHSVDEINVKELHQELSLISNQLHQNGDSIKGMIDDLNNRKEELVKFISQKNTELQQIASQLQTAQTNSNQISQLLTSSTSTNEKINGLLNQQNQHLEEQKKKADAHNSYLQKQTEAFSKLEADLNASIAIFEEKKVQFDQQLAFVESKKAFFEERNAYLEELIGREVGASLFETFKQRKNELKQPVRMWLWIVGAATLLSFVAIMAIFTNFFGLYGNIQSAFKWENIVVNALKCLPFFFFLYYSIFQYNKERNFQEEYAFKSAAALTIKAYSDILTGPENKDELVLNAVYKVYNSPIGDKNMNVKDVSNILDMIKDIVNKGSNFVTKK